MTDADSLTLTYLGTRPVDAAHVLERLEPGAVGAFLATVPVRLAAGPLAAMAPWRAGRALATMEPERAAALVEGIPAERVPHCLRAMDESGREAVLARLPGRRSRALRRQLRYAGTLVGAHMHVAVATVASGATVSEAIEVIRTAGTSGTVHLHVVDGHDRPLGVVPVAALLEAGLDRRVDALMSCDCPAIAADLPLSQVDTVSGWEGWPERPVVDTARRLVGRLTLARVIAARTEPIAAISHGAGPARVLLHSYGAAASGLARVLGALLTGGGAKRDDG